MMVAAHWTRVFLLGLMGVLLVASSSQAAGPNLATSVTRVEDAKELNRRAVQAFKSGYYDVALENFQRAHELVPEINIRVNMAMTLEKLRRLDEAQENYEACLKENPPAEVANIVQGKLDALRARMSTWGRLQLVIEPVPDITVFAGQHIKTNPAVIWIEPGRYTLVAQKRGFERWEELVDVFPGARLQHDVKLSSLPAPSLNSAPDAHPDPAISPSRASPEPTQQREERSALATVRARGVPLGLGGVAVGLALLSGGVALSGAVLAAVVYGMTGGVPGVQASQMPSALLYPAGVVMVLLGLGAIPAAVLGAGGGLLAGAIKGGRKMMLVWTALEVILGIFSLVVVASGAGAAVGVYALYANAIGADHYQGLATTGLATGLTLMGWGAGAALSAALWVAAGVVGTVVVP